MAWTWVYVANLMGPPGDANAMNRFDGIDASIAAIQSKNTQQDGRLDALKTSHISLDTDGVPYYDAGSMSVQVLQDDDGVPYFIQALA